MRLENDNEDFLSIRRPSQKKHAFEESEESFYEPEEEEIKIQPKHRPVVIDSDSEEEEEEMQFGKK